MARDGSGTFTRTDGTRTGNVWDKARVAGVKIISSDHDTHDQDIADALTQSVSKDGQTVITGNINMGTNGITNAASLDCASVRATDFLLISAPTVPASAGDQGALGTISWDSTYIYICIADDTWQRVAHATW